MIRNSSYFIHATEASHGDLGSVQKDDCVIAISNSGETSELKNVTLKLIPKIEELNEVVVRGYLKKIFQIKRMEDVEGTQIYAGKKNEVILIDVSMANLASNNARQIFNQIPGLNIYQNDDAGLQLNIGGRGLNPNRTANFNTRQNNYCLLYTSDAADE